MITRTIAGREPRPPRENGRAQRRRWANEVRKDFVSRPAALQRPSTMGNRKKPMPTAQFVGSWRALMVHASSLVNPRLAGRGPGDPSFRCRFCQPRLRRSAARRSGRLASSILRKVSTMKMFPLALFPLHSTQYLRRLHAAAAGDAILVHRQRCAQRPHFVPGQHALYVDCDGGRPAIRAWIASRRIGILPSFFFGSAFRSRSRHQGQPQKGNPMNPTQRRQFL